MTDSVWWIPLLTGLAGLFGGGAAGAFINTYFAHRRNRIQPIQYREDISHVFDGVLPSSIVKAAITLTSNGQAAIFDNLHLVSLELANTGLHDLRPFVFHATAINGYEFVYADASNPDSSHSARISDPPTPTAKKKDVEIVLSPFNRTNKYAVTFYLVANGLHSGSEIIILSTSDSVVFRKAGDPLDFIEDLKKNFLGQMILKIADPMSVRRFLGF